MTDDWEGSPAFQALTPSGKRALRLIADEVTRKGGGAVTLSRSHFTARGMGKVSVTFAVKQLRLTGFVVIELGERRATVFRLIDRWRALDAHEAARRLRQARLPMARPAEAEPVKPPKPAPTPKPAKVERSSTTPRPVSLARLSFMDDGP